MIRPNIALVSSRDRDKKICISEDYLNAIWTSGGVGTVLPYTSRSGRINEVCQYFDGFVFCGGGDISPSLYGGDKSSARSVCTARDKFEELIFHEAFRMGKPILGICRGAQAINVFLGGTLLGHIEEHTQTTPRFQFDAPVKLAWGSFLHRIIGAEDIHVNTFHHQAIDRLADGLACDAIADDGIIEAFHHTKKEFCLGIQWHPEAYYDMSSSSSKIFDAFISACKIHRC